MTMEKSVMREEKMLRSFTCEEKRGRGGWERNERDVKRSGPAEGRRAARNIEKRAWELSSGGTTDMAAGPVR